MKWGPFHFLTMFLAFSIEIRVKACWEDPGECVVIAQSKMRLTLADQAGHLDMTPNSVIWREANGTLHYLKGSIRVATTKPVIVRTVHGPVEIMGSTFLAKENSRLKIFAMNGDASITLWAEKEPFVLSQGYLTWLSLGPKLTGTTIEIPQLPFLSSQLQEWAQFEDLRSSAKEAFLNQAREWVLTQRQLASNSSEWKAQHANQWIAQHKASLKEQELSRMRWQKERDSLRKLFRQKNYLE